MRLAYKPHRGRSRVHGVLKIILIVVIVLVVLTIAALLHLRQYMVYTADGNARLQLPFEGQKAEEPSPASLSQPPMITLSPTPSTLNQRWEKATAAQLYGLKELNSQTIEEIARRQDDQVVIEMKTGDGALFYASEQALAPERTDAEVELASVLWRLHSEGRSAAALLSCFQDNWLSKQDKSLALTTSKKALWQDGENNRWLNPYLTENQEYLIGIAEELAKMGFDEIILEDCCFPETGKTERISYGMEESPYTAVIDRFLTQMDEAMAEYNVWLSVITDEKTVLDGENAENGQTRTSLLAHADRIYVALEQDSETTREDLEQAILKAREETESKTDAPMEFYLVSIIKERTETDAGSFLERPE